MNTQILMAIAILIALAILISSTLGRCRRVILVPEGHASLLYQHGKFVRVLAPGRYVHWGRHFSTCKIDLRRAALHVSGQEVLTADHINVTIDLLGAFQVIDPVEALHETQGWQGDLHFASQLALRAIVSGLTLEIFLSQRSQLGPQLLARVQPEALKIGVHVLSLEIKDVTLPDDLEHVFSETLRAKHEALASAERARGESVALQNLVSAGPILENHPVLAELRLMQSLLATQKAGNPIVLNVSGKLGRSKHNKFRTSALGHSPET